MDVLENYKKAWGNQPEETNKLSTLDIYKLSHSKSSSIVKWIFIIGILEFIFWTALNLFIPDSFYEVYDDLNLTQFLNVFMVLHYIVILVFLYLFYNNYRRVSITDNTKMLIKNILRIRKTVKYYVFYNIATVFLATIIINVVLFSDSERMLRFMQIENSNLEMGQMIMVTIISEIIFLLIALVLLWLFYKIIYGILLNKLNKNYKELAKLDESI